MPSAQETVPAPAEQDKANATIEQAEPAPESPGQPGQADSLGSEILVSKRPVAVLASPSASAPVLYGLPAGRQFRMLGHEGSFAHIQDLSSSASGWIDEAALAAQPRVPLASAPSQSRPVAASRPPAANASAEQQKPKASSAGGQVAAGSEPAAPAEREPRGLFGGGGILRNIFGGGN